jgi:hypothetical protein
MAIPVLTYGSKIWTTTKKTQEENIETTVITFLWSLAGYTRKNRKK